MKCQRCKAEIEGVKYAATKYCHKCKVLARKDASARYAHKKYGRPMPKKRRCPRIDWSAADSLIAEGVLSCKEIAAQLGCSEWSIQNRKYRETRIDHHRASGAGPMYDYAKHLAEWLEKVRGKFGGGMDREAFRAWLSTPDGQGLLRQINEEGGL